MEGLDCMELEGDILNPRLCNKCLKSSVLSGLNWHEQGWVALDEHNLNPLIQGLEPGSASQQGKRFYSLQAPPLP